MQHSSTKTHFTALHDEAFNLLIEARNYIAVMREQGGRAARRKVDYLDLTLETMRLTTRLTQVMAWILAQKAVQNAELSVEEGASEKYRLGGQSVCLEVAPTSAAHLPPTLRDLMQRSYDLYRRVDRLDRQIQTRLSTPEISRPRPEDGPRLRPVTTSDRSPRNAY